MYVLDACALIAYLRHESGAEQVRDLLLAAAESCLVHAANLCEVYYHVFRASGQEAAQEAVADLESLGLVVREDMSRSFWQEAGRLKATLRHVPLADCFALALARRENATLVTSDHADFDPIAQEGLCAVRFIR